MRPFRFGSARAVRVRRRLLSAALETLETRQLLAFNPTGAEQEMLELVNRFRAAPQAELGQLVSSISPLRSNDPDINNALSFFRVDGPTLASQFAGLQPAPPLAWSAALSAAAQFHNGFMIAQDNQEHELPGEPTLVQRVTAAGYTGYSNLAENIFAYGESVLHVHASMVIDWGNGPGGIQTPAGHRENLLSPLYRETGLSITPEGNPNTQVGSLVFTQDFGNRFNIGNPYLLGVAFRDANGNRFYQAGEGAGGIVVQAVGAAGTFQTTTMTAGGYQMQVPPGAYQVTFTGGTLSGPATFNVVVGAGNAKLDLLTNQGGVPNPPPPPPTEPPAPPPPSPPGTPPETNPLVRITQVQVGNGTAKVGQATVYFTGLVLAPGGSFGLVPLNKKVKPLIVSALSQVSGDTGVVTLKFKGKGVTKGALPAGRYRLTVYGDYLRDAVGRTVDVDGNGTAGGTVSLTFTVPKPRKGR